MQKYQRLQQNLETKGTGKMKVFGSSMLPLIKSGSLLTFEKREGYAIGDVVFCKVRGRIIDAHRIIRKDLVKGYLIANYKGYENGWTRIVYGKAITTEFGGNIKDLP